MQRADSLLADFLKFNPESKQPLHKQLCQQLRQCILEGTLLPGSVLPASRQLSKETGLSRNTVIAAYEQLIEEGLLESKHGSGTKVAENLAQFQNKSLVEKDGVDTKVSVASRMDALPSVPSSVVLFGGNALLAGFPDLKEFPTKVWNQAFSHASNRLSSLLPELDIFAGHVPLRKEIAQYLRVSRGVKASYEQVFITAGASQSLQLITRALTNVGDVVWLEDPVYSVAKMAFQIADLEISPVNVDGQGANPETLPETSPSLIYLTTSYQYPLGYTMPPERRAKWLNVAADNGAWIIEDDYDGEFRYSGNPIPALAGFKDNRQTLYMGTFSKTLSPSLRMSYLVVPPDLVDSLRKIYPMLGNESSVITQAALAELIGGGVFFRHVKNMRNLYGGRRMALEESLAGILGLNTRFTENQNAGLHIPVSLSVPDQAVAGQGVAAGLGCTPISGCFHSDHYQNGLLLGFTARNSETNRRAIEVLARVLEKDKATIGNMAVSAPHTRRVDV
ncbi:PLP-dependent aminotransferase family protein [Pseudoteredinibacter isoporae]|uniref:MocR-like pyridoxine biosynthesis transcription factor PdxR n=1 Tax=Pseudoteredinibacter isoporae TaxID=570281 RepID=UPI0031065140